VVRWYMSSFDSSASASFARRTGDRLSRPCSISRTRAELYSRVPLVTQRVGKRPCSILVPFHRSTDSSYVVCLNCRPEWIINHHRRAASSLRRLHLDDEGLGILDNLLLGEGELLKSRRERAREGGGLSAKMFLKARRVIAEREPGLTGQLLRPVKLLW
jgi:hypothetical protein